MVDYDISDLYIFNNILLICFFQVIDIALYGKPIQTKFLLDCETLRSAVFEVI